MKFYTMHVPNSILLLKCELRDCALYSIYLIDENLRRGILLPCLYPQEKFPIKKKKN